MTDVDLPPLPLFDRRRTRWAVARGLARTAFVVLVSFFLLSLLAQLLGNLLMNALNRADAMTRVGFTGYQVGHPGLDLQSRGFHVGSLNVTGGMSASTADGVSFDVPVKMSLFGTLSRPPTQRDPLDRTLLGPGSTPREASGFLLELPSGVRVDAVVQLARPLRTGDALALAGPLATVIYSPVFGTTQDFIARPVSWSQRYWAFDFHTNFLGWARSLKGSDDENLRVLGLPDSHALQRLAEADRVYAFYVRDWRPAQLKALLSDPRVKSFTPAAVRFALPAQATLH